MRKAGCILALFQSPEKVDKQVTTAPYGSYPRWYIPSKEEYFKMIAREACEFGSYMLCFGYG